MTDNPNQDYSYNHASSHTPRGADELDWKALFGGTYTIYDYFPLGAVLPWPRDPSTYPVPTGWTIMDGTAVDPVSGDTTANMKGKFPMGAGGAYALLSTGGSDSHDHTFTHESAHAITQPVFAGSTGHTITQPVVDNHGAISHTNDHSSNLTHSAHAHTIYGAAPTTTEVLNTPATGLWVVYNAAAGTAAGQNTATTTDNAHTMSQHGSHTIDTHGLSTNVSLTNNSPHTTPTRSVDVALTNNHSGGAVQSKTTLPPYAVSFWWMMKTSVGPLGI